MAHSRALKLSILALTIAPGALVSHSALACDVAAPRALSASLPKDGASGVPIDVSPVILGNAQSLSVEAPDGLEPPYVVNEYPGGIEVIFEEGLAKNTKYVLTVASDGEAETLTFTTGEESFAGPVEPRGPLSVSGLVAQEAASWLFACASSETWLCVQQDTPKDAALAVRFAGAGGNIYLPPDAEVGSLGNPFYYAQEGQTQLMAGDWDGEGCVEVGLRDLSGKVTGWKEYCPDRDFPVAQVGSLDTISCSGGELSYSATTLDEQAAPPPQSDAGANSLVEKQDGGTPTASGTKPPSEELRDAGETTKSAPAASTTGAGALGDASSRSVQPSAEGAPEQGAKPAAESAPETDDEDADAERVAAESSGNGACAMTPANPRTEHAASWFTLLGLALLRIGRRRHAARLG